MKNEVFRTWTLVLQLGITILVPIFLLVALGYFVKENMHFDIMMFCIVFGVLVGVRNAYSIISNFLRSIDKKEKESELVKKHQKNLSVIMLLIIVANLIVSPQEMYSGSYFDINGAATINNANAYNSVDHKFITRIGYYYYYFDASGNLYTSGDVNRLKRINDTFYFVNNDGIIFAKRTDGYICRYNVARDVDLEKMIGKELSSESIAKLENKYDIITKKMSYSYERLENVIAKDDTIYISEPNRVSARTLIIGDSYAYLLMYFTDLNIKYAVCPGYNLSNIKNEILDIADFDQVKNTILFIGPNDLMDQTRQSEFAEDLYYIIDYIQGKGSNVILINYFAIPNTTYLYGADKYENVIRSVAAEKNCKYVDLREIDEKYGRDASDFYIHPPNGFYQDAILKILDDVNS